MKIEKLPRDFVYTDRRTLDDFLRSDDLNKELYKVYLRVKDRPYYFKFDAEKAFNEAYYIATLAMYDPHPELNVREWLWIATAWAAIWKIMMIVVGTE
ncbi:MAG: hypothetical protein IJQ49_00975 [Prevotella sp.]|nr:hypothetical protein [Prevotella sp.]